MIFGPGHFLRSDGREPLRAALDDVRHAADRFHVVDHGGHAVQARVGRKRRLEPRLAAFAFERFEHGSLFAADVGARTAVQDDVHREIRAQNPPTDITLQRCLLDRAFEDAVAFEKLAADIHKNLCGANGVRRDNQDPR